MRGPIRLFGLALGAVGAFGVFGSWLIGPLIWITILLLDRFIFFYLVASVTNVWFDVDPDKCEGVGLGQDEVRMPGLGTTTLPAVGLILTDSDYAQRMFEWVCSWNGGDANDTKDGNITASLVIETDSYIFCCYPSFDRGERRRYFEELHVQQLKEGDPTLVQAKLLFLRPFTQKVDVSRNSDLPNLIKRYSPGRPVVLQFLAREENTLRPVGKIILRELSIKHREALSRRDLEYDLVRLRYPEEFDPRNASPLPETAAYVGEQKKD